MEIGIIGTGDMGRLYAREFAKAGYRVNCCDLPEKAGQLEKELANGIYILNDGIAVSRRSDLIFYLVETENIEKAAAQYGPSTKKDAIVSSGTSVMTPAINAFLKYLPADANIINWHWLFGASVEPKGQSTALVNCRSSDEAYKRARDAFESIGTNIIELQSCQKHDNITADTQVVTQLGFISMGTAWKNMGSFPWENPTYVGGIDNVKVLMCLRIYGGKAHVYSGLAILNQFAKEQVKQYAASESELFKLMIKEDGQQFKERIRKAGESIFGNENSPILLDDRVMGEFNLGKPAECKKSNSHLSLLSMVDAWHKLGINPYDNLTCQTPPFRLRLGIAEYLFRNSRLLEESIETALSNKGIRGDDLEFHTAVREWASIIGNGDTLGYKNQFEETKEFFKDRLEEGRIKSNDLIRRLASSG
ncbi:MAG: prephenate dehydrogenase [archaeon]